MTNYILLEERLDEIFPIFEQFNTFSIDLETTGLNPLDSRIIMCQIGFPDGSNYVINAWKTDIKPIVPYLENKRWLKLVQNAKFESKFFLHYFGCRINHIWDTMLAEQLIMTDLRIGVSLADLTLRYTGKIMNKTIRESFENMKGHEFTDQQLSYGAGDVEVLFPIYNAQLEKINDKGLLQVAELEFNLVSVVASMEEVGVPINQEKWNTIVESYRQKHETSRLKLHDIIYDQYSQAEQLGMFERASINFNSPKQIKDIFIRLGIALSSTDERTLGLINHPVAKELLEYRKFQKVITSYGESFLNKIHPFSNRIHADFAQIGTETGRFSCREPNLQQMPDEFRQCVSDPKYSVVVADFSQFELRVLAEFSRDPVLIKAFNSGEDLHKVTASIMLNIPIEKVTHDQRFLAKTLNFGMTYGMGYNKLADMLNHNKEEKDKISQERAKQLVYRYKQTYKKATEWLNETGTKAVQAGYSTTLYGRKRFFTRPKFQGDQNLFDQEMASIKRQGANSPIQGSNADITKIAMINLHEDLKNYFGGAKIILQVHDEIVVLAHKSQAEAVKNVVVDTMVKSAQELIKAVPVSVGAYVSDCWKKGD